MAENNASPSAEATRATRALQTAYIILAAAVSLVIAYLFIAWRLGAWQMYVLAGFIAAYAGLNFFAARAIRAGRVDFGAWMIIGGMMVVFPAAVLLISGIALIFGLAQIILILMVASQSLPPKDFRKAALYGAPAGILTAGIDFLSLPYRYYVPELRAIVPFATAAIGLALLGTLLLRGVRRSLRMLLTISLLAVTLVPLAINAYVADVNMRQMLLNEANGKLLNAANGVAKQIDDFINFNLDLIRQEGNAPAIVDYVSLPSLQRAGSPEEQRANLFLLSILKQSPVYMNSVAILDVNGITLLDSDPQYIGDKRADRNYFQKTLSSGLPYASGLEYSQDIGIASVYFAAPIRNRNGQIIGILRKRFDAAILQSFAARSAGLAGESSFAIVVDEHGMQIAHSLNRDFLYKFIVPPAPDALANLQKDRLAPPGAAEQISTNLPEFKAGIDRYEISPFFAAEFHQRLEGETGEIEQAALAKTQSQPWLVAFIQPQIVFYAPLNAQRAINIAIALTIAILVATFGVFLAQSISAPLIRLAQTAGAIAGGELNAEAKIETQNEIGTLARAFNHMTRQLRDLIATLELRVAQRTQALATVAEIGVATSTILDLDKLLLEVCNLSKARFHLYHAHIYLLDESGENLVLAAGAGEAGKQMKAQGFSIPLSREQSLVARAARERKGVTVNDVRQAPDFLPNPLLPETRAELAAPMIVGDRVIGVFDIQADEVGRFTEADISVQTTLASQVAVSVENARQVQRSIEIAAELAGFRNAVDAAAIVAVTDVSGKIEQVNEQFMRISKYSREELIGQDHRILNSGYHSKEFIRNLWVTIANGKVWRNDIRNKAKDGSIYWVDTTIAPILNEKGKPVKYVAIRFDITQRKQLEAEIQKRAALLGKLDAITQKIQKTNRVELALQVAARELGQALGMKPTAIAIEPEEEAQEKQAKQ